MRVTRHVRVHVATRPRRHCTKHTRVRPDARNPRARLDLPDRRGAALPPRPGIALRPGVAARRRGRRTYIRTLRVCRALKGSSAAGRRSPEGSAGPSGSRGYRARPRSESIAAAGGAGSGISTGDVTCDSLGVANAGRTPASPSTPPSKCPVWRGPHCDLLHPCPLTLGSGVRSLRAMAAGLSLRHCIRDPATKVTLTIVIRATLCVWQVGYGACCPSLWSTSRLRAAPSLRRFAHQASGRRARPLQVICFQPGHVEV